MASSNMDNGATSQYRRLRNVGVVDATRQVRGVVALGPHVLTLLAHDGGAVPAPRQTMPAAMLAFFRSPATAVVIDARGRPDGAQLRQVAGAEQVRDVRHASCATRRSARARPSAPRPSSTETCSSVILP